MCFNRSQGIYSMFSVAIQHLEINTFITAWGSAGQFQGAAREKTTDPFNTILLGMN